MRKPMIRILLSLLLVVVVAVGGTFAYLTATDSPLLNTFTLAEVETNVEEPSTGTESTKNAGVKNTGKSPVYVRARVVVSGIEPSQLTVNYSSQEDWQDGGDGFYYYTSILQPNSTTSPSLFTNVKVADDVPKDARFSVDVYQESVLAPADGSWTLDAAKAAFGAKG